MLKFMGAVVVVFAVATAILLYPKFSNMGAEYATAQAIRDVEACVRANDGEWPSSSEDLKGWYPEGGEVLVDYSVTSQDLLRDPGRLRKALRPRSGKFYTYPHYSRQLEQLLLTLKETNRLERDVTSPRRGE